MTTYRPEPLVNLKTIGISILIVAILVSIAMGIFIGVLFAIGVVILVEAIKLVFKLIFYHGQHGITLTITDDSVTVQDKNGRKEYPLSTIKTFGRYQVRKYGTKIHITTHNKEIKLFTPDADAIEKDIQQKMTTKGKTIESKRSWIPYIGMTHTVKDRTSYKK